MKKTGCVCLACLMLCAALSGCGKAASSQASGAAAGSDASAGSAGTQTVVQEKEYAPGTRTDTAYTSEWLGLTYTLSENMVMASDDEINSMMQTGAETLYEDSAEGQKMLDYANISTVYEMLAVDMANGGNVVVVAEKLALSGTTEEQYIAALKQQFSGLNVSTAFNDPTTRDVCGITFKELSYTMKTDDGTSTNQTALIKKVGDRMACIMLTYSDETVLNALLTGFSAL